MLHRYQKRLLKVCYVSATSATSSKTFFFFLLRPFTVLMIQTRQAVRAIKQSISLDVYALFIHIVYAFFNAQTPFWAAVKDSVDQTFLIN
jgi:hypothetical protein